MFKIAPIEEVDHDSFNFYVIYFQHSQNLGLFMPAEEKSVGRNHCLDEGWATFMTSGKQMARKI